jgi:hypothetical protein
MGYQNWHRGLAFSPDSKRLLSADNVGPALLWDAGTGERIRTLGKPGLLESAAATVFTRDGQRILTCGSSHGRQARVHVWDAKTEAVRKGFEVPMDFQFRPVFSADGTLLASCGQHGIVRVWDTDAGKELLGLPRHPYPPLAAAFSADDRYLATGGHRNEVHLWELATGGLIHKLPGAGDHLFTFSPDGRILASASWNGTIHLWDVGSGKERRALQLRYGTSINALAFRHDGKALAAAGFDGLIHVWDLAAGKEKLPGADVPAALLPLAFLSGGCDQTILLWDVRLPRD